MADFKKGDVGVKIGRLPIFTSFEEFKKMAEEKKDILQNIEDEAERVRVNFEGLEAARQANLKKIADLDRENSKYLEDEIRLQGEFAALNKILGKGPDGNPLPIVGGKETTN